MIRARSPGSFTQSSSGRASSGRCRAVSDRGPATSGAVFDDPAHEMDVGQLPERLLSPPECRVNGGRNVGREGVRQCGSVRAPSLRRATMAALTVSLEGGVRCGIRQLRITALLPKGLHEHPGAAMPNSVRNSGRDSTRPPGPATDRHRILTRGTSTSRLMRPCAGCVTLLQ